VPYKVEEPLLLEVKDAAHWEYAIDGMKNVTQGRWGTARRAFKGVTYSVAGKSGTAQVFSVAQDAEYDKELLEKRLQDHALFTAFAPADKPLIAVAVVVENGGSGSSVAAPIVRKILDEWLLRKAQKSVNTSSDRELNEQ
jgi:penicillin-binding protein 2